jgi:L-malate glycosyltransferase
MRILHITPWYPNPENPYEALWIRRHIESVKASADQYVLHMAISSGRWFSIKRFKSSSWEEHLILRLPTKRWFIFEIVWLCFLFYYLAIKRINRSADLIQFHISYPSLTYWHLLKRFVKTPIFILEHWSAFHFKFGIKNEHKLKRIKRIFRQRIPVAAVSKALLSDIVRFSGTNEFKCYVLPNGVDTDVFSFNESYSGKKGNTLFMISQWNWPKEPLLFLRAFISWNSRQETKYILRVGGYGHQWELMKNLVVELGSGETIEFLGEMTGSDIAIEMNSSFGFIHCSGYETFSVVCAEALCCGTPVAGSAVGGINELINKGNGILVPENSVEQWCDALTQFTSASFDRAAIANEARTKYSLRNVGQQYLKIINDLIDEANG